MGQAHVAHQSKKVPRCGVVTNSCPIQVVDRAYLAHPFPALATGLLGQRLAPGAGRLSAEHRAAAARGLGDLLSLGVPKSFRLKPYSSQQEAGLEAGWVTAAAAAAGPLLARLEDSDETVRLAAAGALHEVGPPSWP